MDNWESNLFSENVFGPTHGGYKDCLALDSLFYFKAQKKNVFNESMAGSQDEDCEFYFPDAFSPPFGQDQWKAQEWDEKNRSDKHLDILKIDVVSIEKDLQMNFGEKDVHSKDLRKELFQSGAKHGSEDQVQEETTAYKDNRVTKCTASYVKTPEFSDISGSCYGGSKVAKISFDDETASKNLSGHESSSEKIKGKPAKTFVEDASALNTKSQAIKKPIRVDVLNKTIIRSLKRYYTQLFESQYPSFEQEHHNVANFEELTSTFTFNLFSSLLDDCKQNGVSLDDVVFAVRMLIQPDATKKVNKTREQRFLMNNYYDCIYKYSHKRLLKLCQNSTISYLFLNFINSGIFHEQVMSDPTMMKSPATYLEAGESMKKLFEH